MPTPKDVIFRATHKAKPVIESVSGSPIFDQFIKSYFMFWDNKSRFSYKEGGTSEGICEALGFATIMRTLEDRTQVVEFYHLSEVERSGTNVKPLIEAQIEISLGRLQ